MSCDDAGSSRSAQRFEVFTGAGQRRDWGPLRAAIVAESYSALAQAEHARDKASHTTDRPRKANRGSLPAHLERIEQVVDIDDKACPCCGGVLHQIGEDVAERLDVVPATFRVCRRSQG